MSATVAAKRQLMLLRKIAKLCNYRMDAKIPAEHLSDAIAIQTFAGGTKYVDKQNPQFDGGSELSHDLNTLVDTTQIKIAFLRTVTDSMGGWHLEGDAIGITNEGLARIAESEKSAWKKAYEKQPVTAWQVGLAIIQIIVTIGLFLWNVSIQQQQRDIDRRQHEIERQQGAMAKTLNAAVQQQNALTPMTAPTFAPNPPAAPNGTIANPRTVTPTPAAATMPVIQAGTQPMPTATQRHTP